MPRTYLTVFFEFVHPVEEDITTAVFAVLPVTVLDVTFDLLLPYTQIPRTVLFLVVILLDVMVALAEL